KLDVVRAVQREAASRRALIAGVPPASTGFGDDEVEVVDQALARKVGVGQHNAQRLAAAADREGDDRMLAGLQAGSFARQQQPLQRSIEVDPSETLVAVHQRAGSAASRQSLRSGNQQRL